MNTNLNEKLEQILNEAVEAQEELGCQLVIYQDGQKIVDLSAGYTGTERTEKVNADTLFPVFSTGKSIAATAVHRLVERNILSYDTCIADLWPEFACNGKESMTIEDVLRHQSGVFEYPSWDTYTDIADWKANCRKLAAATPAWGPGDKTRYQSLNFTWLLCEPAQLATGKTTSEIIQDEVFGPAGIDSMFFGIDDEQFKICSAPLNGPDMPEGDPKSVVSPICKLVVKPEIRRGCMPGFNCISNAGSLAKYYAALIGSLPGVPPLLSKDTFDVALKWKPGREESSTPSPGGIFGLGYFLWGPNEDPGAIFGHHGCGGAFGLAVPDKKMAVAFTHNLLHVNFPGATEKKIFQELGITLR